ncbi:thiamine phosphate synthase [Eionea flava]
MMPTPTTGKNTNHPPIVWTIAASDSGGGAGVQADIKTFFDLGVHGCSAITGLTAQNTQGVHQLSVSDNAIFEQQLGVLASDLPPVAIKIGVLLSAYQVEAVASIIRQLDTVFVVFDPVLAPTSGIDFSSSAIQASFDQLYPLLDLITPNIPEAELLTGLTIGKDSDRHAVVDYFLAKGVSSVLIKGGHNKSGEGNTGSKADGNPEICQDLLFSHASTYWLTQRQQDTVHSHGTGCVLSAAIAAFVAQDKALHDAVVLANAYISRGLRAPVMLDSSGRKRGAVGQTGWPCDLLDFPQVSHSSDAIFLAPFPVCDTQQLGLYPVIDSLVWLEKLLVIGVKTIQLRVKNQTGGVLDNTIKQAVALGKKHDARLFINDYWALAIKYQAYGVHLGQEDMADADVDAIRAAGLRLGVSTHSEYEFSYAATFKPSYLAIGAIFPTDTKEVVEVGLDNLYRWATILDRHYPLVAIGGINPHNIQQVLGSGVGSIAVVSAITRAEDYVVATQQLSGWIDDTL